ncbi:hypothetical protein IAE22_32235, partial [Bacillus sp. S34]|nr:hypothetical protein [Bacillus sp. S34]
MFDHAAVYGGWHGCEERFGSAVTLSPSERAEIVLQTKVGIRPTQKTTVTGIEMFRKLLDKAEARDNTGLLIGGIKRED